MNIPYYNTMKRAELVTLGYVRIHSEAINIPKSIQTLCLDYFGYFFVDPNKDPSNFITKNDMEKANNLKEEANKLIKQKHYAKALAKYTEALSFNPNDGIIRSNRSLCYLKLNDFNNAFCDARFAIYNEPTWHKSWLRMAKVFEEKQQYLESMNMIDHCIEICQSNHDKKNVKILKKYYLSIHNKYDNFIQLYPDKENINHLNDEDRVEWKHCEPGLVSETFLTDKTLLDTLPYKIQFYTMMIVPRRLARVVYNRPPPHFESQHSAYYEEDYEESEYDRWNKRKWITKCHLFEILTHYKLLLLADVFIYDAPQKFDEGWTVTWSALNSLYLNKRWFDITIVDSTKHLLLDGTYCKPSAKYLIQCIKRCMLCPRDAMNRFSKCIQSRGNIKELKMERKPRCVNIQYRMKDEFEEISFELSKYGIYCRLMPFDDDLIESCKRHNTNPYGWNYLDLKPYYRYDNCV